MDNGVINTDYLSKLKELIRKIDKDDPNFKKLSFDNLKEVISKSTDLKCICDAVFLDFSKDKIIDKEILSKLNLDNKIRKIIDAYLDIEEYSLFSDDDILKLEKEIESKKSDDIEINDFMEEDFSESFNLMGSYLQEISKYKVLTREEEKDLFKQYESGSEEAKEKLIKHNLKLVIPIAKRYANPEKYPLLDCIQNGNIGLIKAIDKFDYTKGYKLSTYAMWWIRQSISREGINTQDSIRVPVYIYDNLVRIKKVIKDFKNEFHRQPTISEIAKIMKCRQSTIEELLAEEKKMVSLNSEISDEDRAAELGDFVADSTTNVEDDAIRNTLSNELNRIADSLKYREKMVLVFRYGAYSILSDIEKRVIILNRIIENEKKENINYIEYNDILKNKSIEELKEQYNEKGVESTFIQNTLEVMNLPPDYCANKEKLQDIILLSIYNKVFVNKIDFKTYKYLSEKYKNVLESNYEFIPDVATLERVGNVFGLTRERIRQIESKSLRKLRYRGKKNNVDNYLD